MPLAKTSIWKFFGSFSLESGSLSDAVAIGGGTTGARFAFTASSGRACAHGGAAGAGAGVAAGVEAAGVGAAAGDGLADGCWAFTGVAMAAKPPAIAASRMIREHDRLLRMAILPVWVMAQFAYLRLSLSIVDWRAHLVRSVLSFGCPPETRHPCTGSLQTRIFFFDPLRVNFGRNPVRLT